MLHEPGELSGLPRKTTKSGKREQAPAPDQLGLEMNNGIVEMELIP